MTPNEPPAQPAFDVERVKARLPSFSFQCTDFTDVSLRAYRQFYRIEFENEFPELSVSIGVREISGYRIALHYYRLLSSFKGTVFLLHGYYDHVGIFNHILRALLQGGYSVVSFDLPGHGLSGGDKVAIPDFNRYQIIFRHVLGLFADVAVKPWHAVAQSTGGAIVMDCLLDHASRDMVVPFHRAALLAPLLRPRGYDVGRYVHRLVSPFSDYVKRGFALNSHSEEFLHFLRNKDPLQSRHLSARWVGALKEWVPGIESSRASQFPLLVIQGQQDGTVEYEHNLQIIREKFPVMELVLIPAARHQLVNESADLRDEIFHSILRYLAI
jgi:alpha-beta hydrolase superfamily lysophospholipase